MYREGVSLPEDFGPLAGVAMGAIEGATLTLSLPLRIAASDPQKGKRIPLSSLNGFSLTFTHPRLVDHQH
jgi:hypothetical protein